MLASKNENKYLTLIWVLSIVIPIAVAFLLFMPSKLSVASDWISILPHLNAVLNTSTAIALLAGLWFIRRRQISYHKTCMLTAFTLGSLFLISYVIYHASAPSTIFGDLDGNGILSSSELTSVGSMRMIYLIILLSHILLAIVVVPFVLLALFHGLNKRYEKHRKIVKYTFPIWLYVSVTGVIVYLMISPYY